MTGLEMTPQDLAIGAGVALALLVLWRSGARRARAAADAARSGARVVSLAGRVLVTAAVIVGAQWLVVTRADDHVILLVVLGLPALFAAHTITRAVTVTTLDTHYGDRRRGGGRR